MASRLELHEELCAILGSEYVYFSPPESVKLSYPCIVYDETRINKRNANNKMYKSDIGYEVTVIDRDPDSEIHRNILSHFPMCSFDRSFNSDNLKHWILTLYY